VTRRRLYQRSRLTEPYGIECARVESLSDLTRAVKQALGSDQPRLIEVTERRLAGS